MIEGKTTKAQRWWWFGNSQYQEYLDAIDVVWAKRIAITDTFSGASNPAASKNPARASEEPLLLH